MCGRRWLPRATLWYSGLCLGVPLQVSYRDSCLNIETCVRRWLPRATLRYSGLCLGVPLQVSYLDSCLSYWNVCSKMATTGHTVVFLTLPGSPTTSKLSGLLSEYWNVYAKMTTRGHTVVFWTLPGSPTASKLSGLCLRTDVRKNIKIFRIWLKSTRNYSELCKWKKMQYSKTLPLILHYVVSNYEALSLLGDCSFVKAEKN
jgi:hypothetical protein